MATMAAFEDLISQTIIRILGAKVDSGYLYHSRDCCETVLLEDICGDIDWLIGSPVLHASDVSTKSLGESALPYLLATSPELYATAVAAVLIGQELTSTDESCTWTFYRLSTIKGTVVLRWYGTSNGYYSETVDFELCEH